VGVTHDLLPIDDCHVPLKNESPQVKPVNNKEIPSEMSCDKYIEIFNSLIDVRKIFHPIGLLEHLLNPSTTRTSSRSVIRLAQ